jgi:hypothetical protein
VLSYSYKLGNLTPATYAFTFAIEIPLSLPGVPARQAELKADKLKYNITEDAPITVNDITEWEINDEEAGVRIEFVTQKKINLWLFTQNEDSDIERNRNAAQSASIKKTGSIKKSASIESPISTKSIGMHGTTLMITSPTEIESNSTQSFTGRICFKKIRMRGGIEDAV